jgi:phage replication O-like protein O
MASPQVENGHTDIANEIMDALAKTRIPGEARQVLDFILRKTYGWHKKEDRIPLSQFVSGTGIRKTHILRAIRLLLSMNLITQKGNDKGNIYRFNKDYHTWKSLPKKGTFPKKGTGIPQKGNNRSPKRDPQIIITKETIQKKGRARFAPPSLEEVSKYCSERKNHIDAEKFIDYYAVSGWKKANGNPVTNWKQCVITWESKENQGQNRSEEPVQKFQLIGGQK